MSETCKFADVDSHFVKTQKIQNLRFSFSGVVKKYSPAQAAFGKSVVRSIVASKQAAAHDIFSLRFFFEYQKIVVSVSCLCLSCPCVSCLCLLSLSLSPVSVSCLCFCLLSLSSVSSPSLSLSLSLSLSFGRLLLYFFNCNFD